MSNWTHVAGIIRIDDFRSDNETLDFDKIIGKECTFESPNEVWEDMERNPCDYLPMGSEGSLRKSVWINPNKDCLAAYTISIFGDLRDHDDADGIIKWFREKCNNSGFIIRQAVITVGNERYGTKTYVYSED